MKKNVLVVTGKLAANTVKASVNGGADVLVLDIEVAAFTTPALLKRSLPPKKYDLILIPGLASGDFQGLEKELGIPVRLGPKHAVDLGFVLSFSEGVHFSSRIPACELLIGKKRSNAFQKVSLLEQFAESPLSLRSVKIGGNSRMKVMAEIAGAGSMSRKELTDKIIYFVERGADIIDLGISLDTSTGKVRTAVETARSLTDIPLSIDTLDPDLINEAIDAGIDIVLSLNSKNIDKVKDKLIQHSTASVVIPDQTGDIESLFQNIRSARDSGIRNIIADPVLEPAGHGLTQSINRYYEFRKRDATTPLFFGVGNVTELVDADSIGIHAILTSIAMELDANILFTPEFSHKAHDSVNELKTASIMMMLSRDRKSAPKDLGVDMLAIKEKRRREFGVMPESSIEAKGSAKWHLDPAGCFKIELTDDQILKGKVIPGKIIVRNIIDKNDPIAGSTAKDILDTIIERRLISRLDHAAYLGRELMKAEIALKFKRSYSQDDKF
ncbi:MAG: dihydropteroate synthase-like protein [Candidatus Methanoperedens sp.]